MINDSHLLRISAFAIICFYASVLFFNVNVPQQDDFDSILAYLINSERKFADGLFDIHVSHRIVLTRLLAKLTLVFNSSIDFRLLSYFGSLALLGVACILYKSTQGIRNRQLAICVTCLCLFSLFHWSNIAWATSSIQNYTIIFAVVLCFYFFDKQSNLPRLGAIVIGMLAPYISSSGLLLLPILFLWTLMRRSESRQKLTLYLLLFAVANLASFGIFFLAFDDQTANSATISILDSTSVTSVIKLISSYLIACAGYLHFAPVALSAGIVLNLYFLLLIRLKYHQKNRVVFYSYLFLLLSFCIIALFRNEAAEGGIAIQQLIASRYQVYSLLINALAVISFFELELDRHFPFKYFKQLVLALFVLLYLSSFYYLSNLNNEKQRLIQAVADFQKGESTLHYLDQAHAKRILEEAAAAEIYKMPASL